MEARCPGKRRILEMLRVKNRVARDAFVYDEERRRYVMDSNIIASYARRILGELYDIEEEREPPPSAYRAFVYTLPGLVACLHKIEKEEGLLKNEVMIIEGPGGVGKSTLAYYIVRYVGGVIVHYPDELIEVTERLVKRGEWIPVLVLDDIAAMISKYWFMDREERRWADFFKLIEYVRDWAGLMLLTARSYEGIAKRFRELASYRGHMRNIMIDDRYMVTVVTWVKTGEKRPTYVDVLWPNVRVPEEDFRRSMEKRKERVLELLNRMKEVVEPV